MEQTYSQSTRSTKLDKSKMFNENWCLNLNINYQNDSKNNPKVTKSVDVIGLMRPHQCCNEDWKWTEDEYEDSSDSENRPKTNTKNLR